jgi:hypothetical protein
VKKLRGVFERDCSTTSDAKQADDEVLEDRQEEPVTA